MKHHFIATLLAVTFSLTALSASKGEHTSCRAPQVQIGDNATITCDFGRALDPSQTEISVVRINDTKPVSVVDCFPQSANTSICRYAKGYQYETDETGAVRNPFVVRIPHVTPEFAGTYECHLVPSKWNNVTPCELIVTERPTTPTTQSTLTPMKVTIDSVVSTSVSTEHSGQRSADDTEGPGSSPAIIAIVVVVVLIAVIIAALILLKRKRCVKRYLGGQGKGDNSPSLMENGTLTSPPPELIEESESHLLQDISPERQTVSDERNDDASSECSPMKSDEVQVDDVQTSGSYSAEDFKEEQSGVDEEDETMDIISENEAAEARREANGSLETHSEAVLGSNSYRHQILYPFLKIFNQVS